MYNIYVIYDNQEVYLATYNQQTVAESLVKDLSDKFKKLRFFSRLKTNEYLNPPFSTIEDIVRKDYS